MTPVFGGRIPVSDRCPCRGREWKGFPSTGVLVAPEVLERSPTSWGRRHRPSVLVDGVLVSDCPVSREGGAVGHRGPGGSWRVRADLVSVYVETPEDSVGDRARVGQGFGHGALSARRARSVRRSPTWRPGSCRESPPCCHGTRHRRTDCTADVFHSDSNLGLEGVTYL